MLGEIHDGETILDLIDKGECKHSGRVVFAMLDQVAFGASCIRHRAKYGKKGIVRRYRFSLPSIDLQNNKK